MLLRLHTMMNCLSEAMPQLSSWAEICHVWKLYDSYFQKDWRQNHSLSHFSTRSLVPFETPSEPTMNEQEPAFRKYLNTFWHCCKSNDQLTPIIEWHIGRALTDLLAAIPETAKLVFLDFLKSQAQRNAQCNRARLCALLSFWGLDSEERVGIVDGMVDFPRPHRMMVIVQEMQRLVPSTVEGTTDSSVLSLTNSSGPEHDVAPSDTTGTTAASTSFQSLQWLCVNTMEY